MSTEPVPEWWLDAMREGCTTVLWEDAHTLDIWVAATRYFFRS